MRQSGLAFVVFLFILASLSATSVPSNVPASSPRARDLGVPFDGTPGDLNAITDVAGVLVGHTTLISGDVTLGLGRNSGNTDALPN